MAPARRTVEQLDKEIDATKTALAKLGGALFELDAARERLAPTASGLTGASAARWTESGEQLGVLWSWYQAVSEVLTALAASRQASKLRPADLEAVWDQLTGSSVELPADSLDTARRCLNDAAGVGPRVPIALVIQVLTTGYDRAAETVAELSAVREMVVPRLDELDQELGDVARRAQSEGVRLPNEAHNVKNAIADLRNQLGVDPLSADVSGIPSLAADLQEVKAAVDRSVTAVGAVAEGFEHLERGLEAARADISAVSLRMTEVAEKIAGPVVDAGPATRLDEELAALQTEVADARRIAAADRAAGDRELRALTPRVSALGSAAAGLLRTVDAPLAHRQELRGRLGAYRAKAQALGRAEDFSLDQLYRAAQDALYTAPSDLAAAEEKVAAYQSAVLEPPVEDRMS